MPPTPPEGYSAEQAEENIQSYRDEMSSYRAGVSTIQLFRRIGLARVIALEAGLVTQEEKDALKKMYRRYLHNDIDSSDDPRMIGSYVYELLNDHGDAFLILEADVWLQRQAGLIDQERVAQVLKRIRLAREWQANPGSAGEDTAQAESGAQASSDQQLTHGKGRRRAKVGKVPK